MDDDKITLRQAGRVVHWSPREEVLPTRPSRSLDCVLWAIALAIPLAAAAIVALTVDHGQ